MCFMYNFGSSGFFGQCDDEDLEKEGCTGSTIGTSDATEKLSWLQAVWSGLVAKTTGFTCVFSLYPKNCFTDTLRKC